jgi:hypothetical protein
MFVRGPVATSTGFSAPRYCSARYSTACCGRAAFDGAGRSGPDERDGDDRGDRRKEVEDAQSPEEPRRASIQGDRDGERADDEGRHPDADVQRRVAQGLPEGGIAEELAVVSEADETDRAVVAEAGDVEVRQAHDCRDGYRQNPEDDEASHRRPDEHVRQGNAGSPNPQQARDADRQRVGGEHVGLGHGEHLCGCRQPGRHPHRSGRTASATAERRQLPG